MAIELIAAAARRFLGGDPRLSTRSSGVNRGACRGPSTMPARANLASVASGATRCAKYSLPADGPIRVGLAGLTTEASAVTQTTFLPCPNIAAAAHQITELAAGSEIIPSLNAGPTICAGAAIRGFWQRPDTTFANAVRTPVTKDYAPNLDMPKAASIEACDALLDAPAAPPTPHHSRLEAVPDNRQRPWSSTSFSCEAGAFRRCVEPRSAPRSGCRESATAPTKNRPTFGRGPDESRPIRTPLVAI
jgi:hypothetical protein